MQRHDLQYVGGKIKPVVTNGADIRRALPEVELTDRLGSSAWGVSIKRDLVRFGYDTDSTVNNALVVQEKIAKSAQNLLMRREKQSPTDTQYTHLNRLTDDYKSMVKQATVFKDGALNSLAARLIEVQGYFEQSLNFDMRDAADIRAALRSANDEQRSKFISQAIESGDGNLLAVVLKSHPITTGVSPEMQKAYRDQALAFHRPDLAALERNLAKLQKLVTDSYADFVALEDDLTAKAIRQQYEREIAEAKAAETREF